ncbi:hypothetical protein A2U01_0119497, partial [Trifolium medium]|nr:hypothetical protein [Trifolium medium]
MVEEVVTMVIKEVAEVEEVEEMVKFLARSVQNFYAVIRSSKQ